MKKRLLALIVVSVLCINPIKTFAAISNSKSKPKVSVDSISDISSVISKSVERSSLVRARRSALDNEQRNYNDTFDASIEIDHRLLKKNKDYFIKVRDIMPLDAEYSLFTASNSLNSTENFATASVYEQYINLIKLLKSIDFGKVATENEKKNLTLSEKKYKIGVISLEQLNQQKRILKKTELQLNTNELNKNILVMNLSTQAGLPIIDDYSNSVDLDILEQKIALKDIYDIKTFDEYFKEALDNREEVVNAKKYLSVSESQLEKIKAVYPSKTETQHKDAINKLAVAKVSIDAAKFQVEKSIKDNYTTLLGKIDEINNLKINFGIEKANYEAIKAKSEKGLVSSREVENSYTKYKNMELDIKNAEYDLWLYRLKFSYTCGIGLGQNISE